jgi:hypothetical protein
MACIRGLFTTTATPFYRDSSRIIPLLTLSASWLQGVGSGDGRWNASPLMTRGGVYSFVSMATWEAAATGWSDAVD